MCTLSLSPSVPCISRVHSAINVEVTSICQMVLEDFNLCLFYLPTNLNQSTSSEDEEELDWGYTFLPDLLIFRMMVICLISVHSLKKTAGGYVCVAGVKQYSAAIAFTLALFSHLVNHVNIRLQAELEDGENAVPSLQTENPDEVEAKEVAPREMEPAPEPVGEVQNGAPPVAPGKAKGKKYSRLSQLRRRRHARQKADESDLSEGFDSDPSDESAKESERSDSGTDKSEGDEEEEEEEDEDEEEEAEAAFDLESDSDMNSQESRSDLEDMEEESAGGRRSESAPGSWSQPRGPDAADPAPANGPASDSDSAIASNLQALSSQMFQPKRCFRLAPTFSNVVSRPPLTTGDGAPVSSTPEKPCANGVLQAPGAPDH
eukprot:g25446.t1